MKGDLYVLPDGRMTTVNSIIGGQWRIVEHIGASSMSVVIPHGVIMYYVSDDYYLDGNFLKLDIRSGPLDDRSGQDVLVPFQLEIYNEETDAPYPDDGDLEVPEPEDDGEMT